MTALTIDEARSLLVVSAARCLSESSCGPAGLHAMLLGLPAHKSWRDADRSLAREHREVLEWVCENGYSWVVLDELTGIIDATGVAHDELHDVDVIADQARLASTAVAY